MGEIFARRANQIVRTARLQNSAPLRITQLCGKRFLRIVFMMEITESPVRDLWRIFRIMAEFVEGFDELSAVGPAVSFFGSARAKPKSRNYQIARETASEGAEGGFAGING